MGLVGGYDLNIRVHGRRGRLCTVKEIPASTPTQVKKAIEASLAVKGSKLFNILPLEIRNISSDKVIDFKRALDHYLTTVPDEPTIDEQGRAAETNSLLHQIPQFHR